jgi:hypothetical protein
MHVERQRGCSATIGLYSRVFRPTSVLPESHSFSLEYFFHLARYEAGLSKTEPCLPFQTVIVVVDKPTKETR